MHAAFDEAAMADDYQVLEELGSKSNNEFTTLVRH